MSTTSGSRDYGRFDELAEEFAGRYRRGERPGLQEYVDRLPEMAEEIREMFPAMVEVERADGDARGDVAPPSPPIAPQLGQIGDYRIVREVGRGGMGVVYEAEQISLGRRVALKVLPGHVTGDRQALERFRREAKSAARLHHTNIVPVFEVGRDRDVSFYAMQLIQGQGLDQVFEELRRLREPGGKAIGRGPARSADPGAAAADGRPRAAATSILQEQALARMTANLLTGRLAGEGPGGAAEDANGLARTERIDPAATWDLRPAVPMREPPPSPGAPVASSSAVMPGGKHVSDVDTSGRRQPFFRSVAQIGRQTAQGLAYAHARGIVHRDIKPSNLLLDTEGVVWITDFGLAKADDDGMTATGDILGTLRYMAPERFRGEGDARADIYALGLTLYELLTLRPAYDSTDRLRLIERIKNEEPVRPRLIDPQIPRDLETIVLKAIDKHPDHRYPTAAALAEDLRRFLADEPIKARQISASERYWRWARRNPGIAVLGGLLTAVLVMATIGSLVAASFYETSARSEKAANDQSQLDRKAAFVERDRSGQLSAALAFGKGVALAEEGHADRGLLWMIEALKAAPGDAEAFRRTVRWNLGAWLGQVHEPLRMIDVGGTSNYLGFSPDGRAFATGFSAEADDHAISRPIDLWDTASGRRLASFPGVFAPFTFRPDGVVLFAHADPWRVEAIDLTTRQVLWTSPRLPGARGCAAIILGPDASTVFAERFDAERSVWLARLDATTGRQLAEPMHLRGRAALSPDGEMVAVGRVDSGGVQIELLDVSSGRPTASWQVGGRAVEGLQFSPDRKSLYGSQVNGGILNSNSYLGRIWDLRTGKSAVPPMRTTGAAHYAPAADRIVTRGMRGDALAQVRGAADGRIHGTSITAGPTEQNDSYRGSHPDGRTMLTRSGNIVLLWRISPDAEAVADRGGIGRDRRRGAKSTTGCGIRV